MTVTDNLGDISVFDYTLLNGSNFLTITSINGQHIVSTNLSYSLDAGFTDLRQLRIAGATTVPEPTTVTLLGTGLGMIAVRRFRRRARRHRA